MAYISPKTRRIGLIVIAFVAVFAWLTLAGVGHAQESTDQPTIDYHYSNDTVTWQVDDNPYPYTLSALSKTDSVTVASGSTISTGIESTFEWENNGHTLYYSYIDYVDFNDPSETPWVIEQIPVGDEQTGENAYSLNKSHWDDQGTGYELARFSNFETQQQWEWGNNGNDIYRLGSFGDFYVHDASDPYNVSSVNDTPTTYTLPEATAFSFTDNGNRLLLGTSDGEIIEGTLSTAWDISTYTEGDTISYQGSRIYSLDVINNERVYIGADSEYRLSTPGDYSTYEFVASKDIATQRFEWADEGEKLFSIATPASPETAGDLVKWESDVRNIHAEESDGAVISGSEVTTSDSTGSFTYSPDMYQQIQLYAESAANPSLSTISDQLAIYGDGNMSIREEQTNDLITQSVNVTAYGEESGIYTFETSDGMIDITGLPDQSYTFVASSDGYVSRNRYVETIGNVESLYLLSNQTSRVTSQFLLQDTTNTFSSDSRLIIERSIPTNGNDWETIYSDTFGTAGVTVELQENIRYRISLENDEIRRTIGPYRATISESITISPESGEIEIGGEGGWFAGASYDDDNINVRFHDPSDTVDSILITVYERGNESNTLAVNDEYIDPSDVRAEYAVPNQYNESNWIVEITVERNGESTTIGFTVGPTLDTVPANLSPMWRNVISVIIILTFGLGFSVISRAMGAIVLACVAGLLWWLGWLAGATAGVLITAYAFIAIAYGIYTKTIR